RAARVSAVLDADLWWPSPWAARFRSHHPSSSTCSPCHLLCWCHPAQSRHRRGGSYTRQYRPAELRPLVFPALARSLALWQGSPRSVEPFSADSLSSVPVPSACCRSSVVEHSIGNGEVDSSILSGSTIFRHRALSPAKPSPITSFLEAC